MDYEHKGGSSKDLCTFEVTSDETRVCAQHENSRLSSSSESSEESSDIEKGDPANCFTEPKDGDLESQGPTFPPEVSSNNPGISIQESSMRSPQNQTTWQSGGYDPNRIPSSVFAGKPTAEWSVASNESLFSIHIGNSSFSRDHFFMLYKSGELTQLDESSNVPPSLHPVIEEENMERKSEDTVRGSEVTKEEIYHAAKVEAELSPNATGAVLGKTEKITTQEKMPPAKEVRNSSSSTHSFQVPVLNADIGRDSSVKSSVKVEMEQQPSQKQLDPELQPQTPAAPPKATKNSWFSCFSCCSLGC